MTSVQMIVNHHWRDSATEKSEEAGTFTENTTDIWEVALKELREDEKTREQCLTQFKEWIRQNNDIENCITDDAFLLRFLRVKKFSIHQAQQMLLKYLNLRKCYPYIFDHADYMEPKLLEIFNTGYIFASPFKDRKGRRVIITTPKLFDPTKYTSTDLSRVHLITYETLVDDEESQILGFSHVGDVGAASPSMITMWSITEFATLVKWGEQSFPMRHKEIHVMNMPIALQYVYDFCASRVSQKIRDRVNLYNSTEELHKGIDACVLPAEYGGVMPMAEMVELWKKELASKRDRILSLDNMKLLSDKGIVCRKNNNSSLKDADNISGSFRKLEVD